MISNNSPDPRDNPEVRSDYHQLRVICRRLIRVSDDAFRGPREFSHEGFPYFHFMCGIFVTTQLHYMENILTCSPQRVVETLARTMVEGFMKLKWAQSSQEERAQRWFSYAFVQEWKYLKRNEEKSIYTEDEKKELIGKLLSDARDHISDKGVRAIEAGEDPDAFRHFEHDWTALGMYDLAQEVEMTPLYVKFYDPFNDWVHWSSKGLMKTSPISQSAASFSPTSYYQSVGATIAAITSLLGCAKIANSALNAGASSQFQEIEEKFAPWNPIAK